MHRTIRTGLRPRPAAAVAVTLASLLAACSSSHPDQPPVAMDVAAAPRSAVRDGGTLRWAVDAVPATLNVFQTDATEESSRIAAAVLPTLFTVDGRGRPRRDPDFLQSADVVGHEPRQVVVYKLNPKAVWSDGRPITAEDFAAQWRALSGRDNGFWAAHNDGYDRISSVRPGSSEHEVRVTFDRPFAAWRALFTPLYPRSVTGRHDSFNDGARGRLPVGAGPFSVQDVDARGGSAILVRNRSWWGDRPKLDRLELRAVPADRRAAALADGTVDVAPVEPAALPALGRMRGITVHRALGASYTQLTLNGGSGPLADERVRRAVVRAIDRQAVADLVLRPAGLPAKPLGNHLLLASQDGYRDNSSAAGGTDLKAAQALLQVAGWRPGKPVADAGHAARAPRAPEARESWSASRTPVTRESGTVAPGADSASGTAAKPSGHTPSSSHRAHSASPALPRAHHAPAASDAPGAHHAQGAPGAPKAPHAAHGLRPRADATGAGDTPDAGDASEAAAPAAVVEPAAVRTDRAGHPLSLRFVVPAHSATLNAVADRIAHMLAAVGIRTEMDRVSDNSFFHDHIAAGDFDLALYSWPGSPFPAADSRSVYAKPQPAADGSLSVLQNYSRVGTDRIDQLFGQASAELDRDRARGLLQDADARIWAAAASLPLYQRPDLVAQRSTVVNVGAFGFAEPRFQDLGFRA